MTFQEDLDRQSGNREVNGRKRNVEILFAHHFL